MLIASPAKAVALHEADKSAAISVMWHAAFTINDQAEHMTAPLMQRMLAEETLDAVCSLY